MNASDTPLHFDPENPENFSATGKPVHLACQSHSFGSGDGGEHDGFHRWHRASTPLAQLAKKKRKAKIAAQSRRRNRK